MQLAPVALIGVLVALALLVALFTGNGLPGALHLALVASPPLVLVAVAVFTPRVAGWPRRLLHALVGALAAGAAGLATFIVLRGRTDWYEWPDEHGAELFIAVLVLLAALPGAAAAASPTPRRGLALAGGFAVGLAAPLALRGAVGMSVMLGLGVVVGVLTGALARRWTGRPSS